MKRDFNHPSVFSWVLFNETWGLFADGQNWGRDRAKRYAPWVRRRVANAYAKAKAEYASLRSPVALALLRAFRPKLWRKRMLRLVPTPYDPVRGDWLDPNPSALDAGRSRE